MTSPSPLIRLGCRAPRSAWVSIRSVEQQTYIIWQSLALSYPNISHLDLSATVSTIMSYNLSGGQIIQTLGGEQPAVPSMHGHESSFAHAASDNDDWVTKPTTNFTWLDPGQDKMVDHYFESRDDVLGMIAGRPQPDGRSMTTRTLHRNLADLEVSMRWLKAATHVSYSDLPSGAARRAHETRAHLLGQRLGADLATFNEFLLELKYLVAEHRSVAESAVVVRGASMPQFPDQEGSASTRPGWSSAKFKARECIEGMFGTIKSLDTTAGDIFKMFGERQHRCPKPTRMPRAPTWQDAEDEAGGTESPLRPAVPRGEIDGPRRYRETPSSSMPMVTPHRSTESWTSERNTWRELESSSYDRRGRGRQTYSGARRAGDSYQSEMYSDDRDDASLSSAGGESAWSGDEEGERYPARPFTGSEPAKAMYAPQRQRYPAKRVPMNGSRWTDQSSEAVQPFGSSSGSHLTAREQQDSRALGHSLNAWSQAQGVGITDEMVQTENDHSGHSRNHKAHTRHRKDRTLTSARGEGRQHEAAETFTADETPGQKRARKVNAKISGPRDKGKGTRGSGRDRDQKNARSQGGILVRLFSTRRS